MPMVNEPLTLWSILSPERLGLSLLAIHFMVSQISRAREQETVTDLRTRLTRMEALITDARPARRRWFWQR